MKNKYVYTHAYVYAFAHVKKQNKKKMVMQGYENITYREEESRGTEFGCI